MTTPRVRHSAALLPDGRVIVVGGLDDTAHGPGQVVLKSAEVYDPANGTWTPAESLSINRYGFPLVALNDGRLLAIGGASSAGDAVFNASAEIFDASTQHWTMTHDMSEGRGFFPATVLTDGRVLVAGGSIHDGSLLGNVQTGSAEIYDPATDRWSRTGDLAVRRMGARAATLPDGRVIVAGGSLYDIVGNGINLSIVDREVLASSEIWDLYTGVWNPGDNMSESRISFMLAKLLNGAVLATGGNGLDGIARSSANLFK
jgi:N-acetylneuraminic acid mutarotase